MLYTPPSAGSITVSPEGGRPVPPIAIIGLWCWYPGAPDPRSLWENVLARRREFRRMPDVRLPLADYHDPDPAAPDKTYGRQAALIDGFRFDWAAHRIPKQTYDSTDIAQWLALEVAARAIADAGYSSETLPRDRTGVVLGNTLTGEHTRASAMRTRWPFVARALRAAAAEVRMPPAQVAALAQAMEATYKSAFAPVTEDTLAGGLSNTIAGRICNSFDLHGGGFTIDGACSSSLLAVCDAAARLASGELDLALAGGVDISLDTFELIGFAKTGALTPDEMRVYDQRGNGFIPGEGCAFVLLRPLEAALRAGDHVYAVLRGWGMSSDGRGGLTAPSRSGQAAALRRAYAAAGYDMNALAFVEGHGTGTRVGDKTELEAIAQVLAEAGPGPARGLGVTSLKSLVGHTKAAAGIGAFLKAVMAVNRRVIPPTANCQQPHPVFEDSAQRLYPVLQGAVEDPGQVLRAGVSAMGFGGINTHVTLESAGAPSPRLAPALDERALLASAQDAEVLPLCAPSLAALIDQLEGLVPIARAASLGELVDLAAHQGRRIDAAQPLRAALVADAPEALAERLAALAAQLRGAPPAPGEVVALPGRDAFASQGPLRPRVGFLFPGQGSQQIGMARKLVERYPHARTLARRADAWCGDAGTALTSLMFRPGDRARDAAELEAWRLALAQTEVAQPAICLASLLYAQHLARLGLTPVAVGGHSLGELSAFHAAGAFDEQTLLRLAAARGRAMTAAPGDAGAMVSLLCSRDAAEALLARAGGYAVIANINAPTQIIASGEVAAIEAIEREARAQGVSARRLPVSNAFHSRLIAAAAERIASFSGLPPRLGARPIRLFSAMDGAPVPADTALTAYFSAQALRPVDFVSLVEALRGECDLLLEVGPGRVLSGLAGEIIEARGGRGPLCLPVAGRVDSERDLAVALAAAFCHGVDLRWGVLYEQRLVRPFVPAAERVFIDNPCERPLRQEAPRAPVAAEPLPRQAGDSTADLLVQMALSQTGFPRSQVSATSRLLDDLNLDSIKAGTLVAEAARRLGVAGRLDTVRFANAPIAEIAAALDALRSASAAATPATAEPAPAADEDAWVRSFVLRLREEPLPAPAASPWMGARVRLLASADQAPAADELRVQLAAAGATCVEAGDASQLIVLLPRCAAGPRPADGVRPVASLLRDAALAAAALPAGAAALFVQFSGGHLGLVPSGAAPPEACAATGFAASLHLERPHLRVRVVDLPPAAAGDALLAALTREAGADAPFCAAGHDESGVRRVRQVEVAHPGGGPPRAAPLGPADVVLVTGGAKGITAECALALAQASGARFALVGQTPAPAPGTEDEIARTLARFAAAGVAARYYRCDVSQEAAVEELVARVRSDLGPIGAVIHGAGLNRPRRVEQVSLEEALEECAPKLLGGLHLCRALESAPPRLFVAMTSVIGVSGVPGNSWYAFANAALDQVLRRFAQRHPEVQVACAAFSVWSEVGMGARLGSVSALGRLGIGAIPVAEGVRRFLSLVSHDPGEVQAIITARLGNLSTWPAPPAAPQGRFASAAELQRFTPGVEWSGRLRLSHGSDPYLADHCYQGSFLLPTVLGLEAMVQAAATALGAPTLSVRRVEALSLERPIVVGPEGSAGIELHALVLEPSAEGEPRVAVRVRAEASGYQRDHFAATLVLGALREGPALGALVPSAAPRDLQPARDLYGPLLFQGPLFQRVLAVTSLASDHVHLASEVRAASLAGAEGFGPGLAVAPLLLGDPYFRDALLQSVQLTIPRESCLPVRVGTLERYQGADDPGPRQVATRLLRREGDIFVAEVEARDRSGRVVERLSDYRLRVLHQRPDAPSAEELAQRSPSGPAVVAPPAPADPFACVTFVDPSTGRREQRRRLAVTFEDANSVAKEVTAARYGRWIGRTRELAFAPFAARVMADITRGDLGLVTNGTVITLLAPVSALESVEVRMFLRDFAEPAGTIGFEFYRVDADGRAQPVAVAQQQFTWVRILDHGVVTPVPMPAELSAFLRFMDSGAPPSAALQPRRPDVSGPMRLGALVARDLAVPLVEETFATTLEQGNLVGNIYWANYLTWAATLIDQWVHRVAPACLRPGGPGEVQCGAVSIDHAREAMPFDRVHAALIARAVSERGAVLDVHFFREGTAPRERERLAAGRLEIRWSGASERWPRALLQALLGGAHETNRSEGAFTA